jgi:hypothetical protein
MPGQCHHKLVAFTYRSLVSVTFEMLALKLNNSIGLQSTLKISKHAMLHRVTPERIMDVAYSTVNFKHKVSYAGLIR